MSRQELSDTDRRKFRQRMQRATDEQFWDAMNVIHNGSYQKGVNVALEAAYNHPRISKTMTDWVRQKIESVQQYDGLYEIQIEDTIMELITGRKITCPECGREHDGGENG